MNTSDIFSSVIGQDRAVAILRSVVAHRRVPPAFIFSGPDGVGRAKAARALAFALSCEHGSGCLRCAACRANAAGEGVHAIDIAALMVDDAEKIKAAALRRVLASHARTHLLPWLVVIVEHADAMSDVMQTVMLKTAEEPPPGVCYILLSSALETFSPALKSRAEIVRFRPLSEKDLGRILPPEKSSSPMLACAGGSVSRAEEIATAYDAPEEMLTSVFFRREFRGKKRADVLAELSWAVPAAARLRPEWKSALAKLDRAVTSNAKIDLAFAVFRGSIGADEP